MDAHGETRVALTSPPSCYSAHTRSARELSSGNERGRLHLSSVVLGPEFYEFSETSTLQLGLVSRSDSRYKRFAVGVGHPRMIPEAQNSRETHSDSKAARGVTQKAVCAVSTASS